MVYLLHFQKPYRHAGHYLGFCEEGKLDERIERHRHGNGARLIAVILDAGIEFEIARTWDGGDRALERRLKNRKNASKLCPICRLAKETAQKVDVG